MAETGQRFIDIAIIAPLNEFADKHTDLDAGGADKDADKDEEQEAEI